MRRQRFAPALIVAAFVAGPLALPSATAVGSPPGTPAEVLAGMSLEQQVGQVFMVGGAATGVGPATISAIRDRHVGNVILTGRSPNGTGATAQVTAGLQAQASTAATAGVPLLISTDQEGGQVQVLSGPGFSAIPTALTQGTLNPSTLRTDAATWGSQLRAAGVSVNLAPVLDVVPSPAAAANNPPIGWYDREYGYDPATVTSHGTAFAQGMADAGVAATVKHFPGLGRVTANPDYSSGVTDTVTTPRDPYLTPFAAAVNAGAAFLMMSTAFYSRIDPANPAAYSPTIIGGMVRGDLGFTGVVISDSLSAAQLNPFPVEQRAVRFLDAGGDLALVGIDQLPAMYDAVLNRARFDPGFRARVDDAALRVLTAKQASIGLPSALPPPAPANPFVQFFTGLIAFLTYFHLFGF